MWPARFEGYGNVCCGFGFPCKVWAGLGVIYRMSSGMCLEKGETELTLRAPRHPTTTKSTKRIVASTTVLVRLVLARRITRDLDGDPLGSVMVLKALYLAIAKAWRFAKLLSQ